MVSILKNGNPSWYLTTVMWASKPGLALLLGMGYGGNAARVFFSAVLNHLNNRWDNIQLPANVIANVCFLTAEVAGFFIILNIMLNHNAFKFFLQWFST